MRGANPLEPSSPLAGAAGRKLLPKAQQPPTAPPHPASATSTAPAHQAGVQANRRGRGRGGERGREARGAGGSWTGGQGRQKRNENKGRGPKGQPCQGEGGEAEGGHPQHGRMGAKKARPQARKQAHNRGQQSQRAGSRKICRHTGRQREQNQRGHQDLGRMGHHRPGRGVAVQAGHHRHHQTAQSHPG